MPTHVSSKFVKCSPLLHYLLGAIGGGGREEEYGEIGAKIISQVIGFLFLFFTRKRTLLLR